MMASRRQLVLLVLALFLLDRILKRLAVLAWPLSGGDFFYFAPSFNAAGPFSLSLPQAVLLVVTWGALIWLTQLLYSAYKVNDLKQMFGAQLMLVGGFSNVWDRVRLGSVVEIWQLPWFGGFSFNISDIYLLVGLVIIILSYQAKAKIKSATIRRP